ncbi:MAG: GTPase HflX [Desulfobacteraceae bacterium]|nr:MAG: GTPase HflX [Desulfobacteraceae bacterium]
MKKIYGNTGGLKASHIKKLEYLYRRRTPPEFLVTPEIARELCMLAAEIRRQIGLLIDRQGRITNVIVGDRKRIVIPDLSEFRTAPGRLKGLRCVHVHIGNEPLSRDDITDLTLLKLDMMAAITATQNGQPYQIHIGYILPGNDDIKPYRILEPIKPDRLDIGCFELIQAIESELAQSRPVRFSKQSAESAILVSVSADSRDEVSDSMDELKELAVSAGIEVIESFIQYRTKADPKFYIGPGKLEELSLLALQKGATILVFDQELNSSQIRSITDKTDIKIIDRTQLILDIFAQRARTKEGKLQVELAQLKYMLPRLVTKNTAMSRLTGGIGGRGPGETKLELNRRLARNRINQLETRLLLVIQHRQQQRAKRGKKDLPVISIIGYTNAGKSTLLNTLTKSRVLAEKRLFATLDPSSRRLKFPRDTEVIITDTVGFIKNIPKDLLVAFRATLEELNSADLLLHLIDISNPRFEAQIESVEKILSDLNLNNTAMIRVFNKQDLVGKETIERLCRIFDSIPISANDVSTLPPLIEKMEHSIESICQKYSGYHNNIPI